MARIVAEGIQQNLWGSSNGLEAQRVDLWMVDLDNPVKALQAVSGVQLVPVLPQFVQSVSLPEIRLKSEPFRRDSIAYSMPSWDDPLDALKITFIMDVNENANESVVCRLLDAWLAVVRAGRGSRRSGYFSPASAPTLDANYRANFQFDFKVSLLRGSVLAATTPSSEDVSRSRSELNRQNVILQQQQQLLQRNTLPGTVGRRPTAPVSQPVSRSLFSALQVAADYRITGAWLAGYKIMDLSYGSSGVVTVDATFYVDSVDQDAAPSRSVAVNTTP